MPGRSGQKKTRAWVVYMGRKTGVFTTVDELDAQVKGYKGARHDKFKTKNLADEAWNKHISESCLTPVSVTEELNALGVDGTPITTQTAFDETVPAPNSPRRTPDVVEPIEVDMLNLSSQQESVPSISPANVINNSIEPSLRPIEDPIESPVSDKRKLAFINYLQPELPPMKPLFIKLSEHWTSQANDLNITSGSSANMNISATGIQRQFLTNSATKDVAPKPLKRKRDFVSNSDDGSTESVTYRKGTIFDMAGFSFQDSRTEYVGPHRRNFVSMFGYDPQYIGKFTKKLLKYQTPYDIREYSHINAKRPCSRVTEPRETRTRSIDDDMPRLTPSPERRPNEMEGRITFDPMTREFQKLDYTRAEWEKAMEIINSIPSPRRSFKTGNQERLVPAKVLVSSNSSPMSTNGETSDDIAAFYLSSVTSASTKPTSPAIGLSTFKRTLINEVAMEYEEPSMEDHLSDDIVCERLETTSSKSESEFSNEDQTSPCTSDFSPEREVTSFSQGSDDSTDSQESWPKSFKKDALSVGERLLDITAKEPSTKPVSNIQRMKEPRRGFPSRGEPIDDGAQTKKKSKGGFQFPMPSPDVTIRRAHIVPVMKVDKTTGALHDVGDKPSDNWSRDKKPDTYWADSQLERHKPPMAAPRRAISPPCQNSVIVEYKFKRSKVTPKEDKRSRRRPRKSPISPLDVPLSEEEFEEQCRLTRCGQCDIELYERKDFDSATAEEKATILNDLTLSLSPAQARCFTVNVVPQVLMRITAAVPEAPGITTLWTSETFWLLTFRSKAQRDVGEKVLSRLLHQTFPYAIVAPLESISKLQNPVTGPQSLMTEREYQNRMAGVTGAVMLCPLKRLPIDIAFESYPVDAPGRNNEVMLGDRFHLQVLQSTHDQTHEIVMMQGQNQIGALSSSEPIFDMLGEWGPYMYQLLDGSKIYIEGEVTEREFVTLAPCHQHYEGKFKIVKAIIPKHDWTLATYDEQRMFRENDIVEKAP